MGLYIGSLKSSSWGISRGVQGVWDYTLHWIIIRGLLKVYGIIHWMSKLISSLGIIRGVLGIFGILIYIGLSLEEYKDYMGLYIGLSLKEYKDSMGIYIGLSLEEYKSIWDYTLDKH